MSALLCKWFGWWCVAAPIVNPPIVPIDHKEDVKDAIESKSIEAIVNANGCKNISWANRGKAPIGFYLGMAKTYVQTKCDADLKSRLEKPAHSKEDAYSRYGLKPTLPNVYALLTGLAIRESTGDFCEGRDMSAGWTSSDTAESGLHQTSYNSNAFSPYLKVFFKNWNKNGFREDFAKGVTCTANMWKYWGTGADGLRFQKMSKEQPAFHVEYTALLLKETYRHHGPLVRKEVQFQKPCLELFETLDKQVSCP